ncbi:shikimate kinase [Oxyplasma meridianum]|uniref:Shikimate kinase n=1 Tax=Oxyplasma meridianum TaxID=3073602 RepID=A0AAX4NHE4_9ARCH
MEKIEVTVNGGLSVMSAFFNGRGAAVAMDLPMVTTVWEAGKSQTNTVIQKTLEFIDKRYRTGMDYSVSIKSMIPMENGMKSSSAMTLSIIYALSVINKLNLEEKCLLRTVAEASIYNGTSVTGALDDICACYFGGFCLTDNTSMEIIERRPVDNDPVLVSYSLNGRKSGDIDISSFALYRKRSLEIERHIQRGDIYGAMVYNGTIISAINGANMEKVSYFLKHGATHSAQNGKGPAVFAIFADLDEMDSAYRDFNESSQGWGIIKSSLTNKGLTSRRVEA